MVIVQMKCDPLFRKFSDKYCSCSINDIFHSLTPLSTIMVVTTHLTSPGFNLSSDFLMKLCSHLLCIGSGRLASSVQPKVRVRSQWATTFE